MRDEWITGMTARIEELETALRQIEAGSDNGEAEFRRRIGKRGHVTWYAVNALQDYLAASGGTARAALEASQTTSQRVSPGGLPQGAGIAWRLSAGLWRALRG